MDDVTGIATAAAIGCRFKRLDLRGQVGWLQLADFVPVKDVVVNKAGVTRFKGGTRPYDPKHASLADWRAVYRVNLDGTFLGFRYAIGAMKALGTGSIINRSSRSGPVGIADATA